TTDDDRPGDATVAATLAASTEERGEVDELRRGTVIGRYVVLERIGAGGMGVVYAALDPELGRQIALKLVRSGGGASMGDTEHVSAGAVRLLREAQAMARLHHPNVIAVHDVGTVAGRVFIAMAYLDDGTLGAWIDREPRSWTAVLEKFAAAGAGLAAAHAAGIVHRDFKPENVLLGKDGRVCVVDFGLARAANELGETRNDESGRVPTDSFDAKLTRTGALMGTPAYMAPEQHAGGTADARSDQFAFCVALYEALYGQRPFAGDNVASLAASVLDGALRPAPEGNATPRWLFGVVARGLAVMPHARHRDMDALLAALRDDPTVRRRRRMRQAAAVVLVGGGVAASIAYAQAPPVCTHAQAKFDGVWSPDARAQARAAFASSERAHASQAWRRAELELDEYATHWIDAHTEACRATAVRGEQSQDMLDRRMSCLDHRLREVEAVVDLFVTADAGVVDHAAKVLGQIEDVEACSDTAALLAALPPPAMAERDEADDLRSRLARAAVLRTAGRYAEAGEVIADIEHRVQALDYAPLTAEYLHMKAAAEVDAGRPAAGEELLYAAALAAAEAGHQALEPPIWTALVRVVGTHEDRPLQLPPLVKAAEVAVARAGNPVGARGALALVVGTQALTRGEYSVAQERLLAAVAQLGEARGVDHPDTLEAREMLALTYHGRKRYDEAEAALTGIAEAIERTQGASHPSLASVLANLSRNHAARGELELERETGERALAAIVQAYGPHHQATATAHANLATTLRKLARYDEAAAHLDAALAIETELFGSESPRIATSVHGRAQLAFVRGRPQEALVDYREALRIWEATLGADDSRNAYALTGIGKSELELGHAEAAIAALERAVALREGKPDVGADDLAESRFVLARALRSAGRGGKRADTLARQAREVFVQLDADDDVRDVDAWLAAPR
ncbi:MAG TPA: serine/threonine-protein kinase, partial [Nannocystaceae bacterium]|nr:serine/threonine-protein kinase [Nannocystaceae bacterium]